MSDKLKKIYTALVNGAESGLTDKALYKYVVEHCPKATSKKIVKASLLALTDRDLKTNSCSASSMTWPSNTGSIRLLTMIWRKTIRPARQR